MLVHTAADLRPSGRQTRIALFAARLDWIVVALFGAGAFSTLDLPIWLIGSAGVAWLVVAVSLVVPHVVALALGRLIAPGAIVIALITLNDAERIASVAFIVASVFATATILLPALGEWWVNGTSYPNERRLLLRTPPIVLLTTVPLSFVGVAGLPIATALLANDNQPAAAVVTGLASLWFGFAGVRVVSGLARRWLVIVPAGVVVHDLVVLVDPVLIPNYMLVQVSTGDARSLVTNAKNTTLDATGGATRNQIRVQASEPITASFRTRKGAEERSIVDFVVALQRPKRLAEVRALQHR